MVDQRIHTVALTALLLLCAGGLCRAEGVIDAFTFRNAEQEARYQALTQEFRCPKCLNTNLAGSDSPIAADLRVTVHRLILEGASDKEIRAYLVERYGEFVLYDPPVRAGTLLLWLGPALLLMVGFTLIFVLARRRRDAAAPLDEAQRARLDALLRDVPAGAAPDNK
jgi:cytochrome c-type biogenesis protein CcmH